MEDSEKFLIGSFNRVPPLTSTGGYCSPTKCPYPTSSDVTLHKFDAAIIQLSVSAIPFIYENPTVDMNQQVGVLRIYNNGELINQNTTLYKSGRTTGLTSGTFVDKYYYYCTIYACDYYIRVKGMTVGPGDSGAPVYIRILESPPTNPDRINFVAILVGILVAEISLYDGTYQLVTDIYTILNNWSDVSIVSCTTYPTCM